MNPIKGGRCHGVKVSLLAENTARGAGILITIDALRRIDPDWVGPNHCTGDAAVARIRQAFPGRVMEMHAGQSVCFPIKASGNKGGKYGQAL